MSSRSGSCSAASAPTADGHSLAFLSGTVLIGLGGSCPGTSSPCHQSFVNTGCGPSQALLPSNVSPLSEYARNDSTWTFFHVDRASPSLARKSCGSSATVCVSLPPASFTTAANSRIFPRYGRKKFSVSTITRSLGCSARTSTVSRWPSCPATSGRPASGSRTPSGADCRWRACTSPASRG